MRERVRNPVPCVIATAERFFCFCLSASDKIVTVSSQRPVRIDAADHVGAVSKVKAVEALGNYWHEDVSNFYCQHTRSIAEASRLICTEPDGN